MNKNLTSAVSIEKYAAYLDGNLTADEMLYVDSMISSDSMMMEINAIGNLCEEDKSNIEIPEELLKDEFEIPLLNIFNDENELIGDTEIPDDRVLDSSVSIPLEVINLNETNIMATTNPRTGAIVYGEASENISDPIFIQQPDDHSCALRSQQIVLRDFGIDIPFKDLEQIAKDHGVYTDQGTYRYDVGKVLEIAGVGMHQVEGNTMHDLINELSQGHRVIVSVDADELWYDTTLKEKMNNWVHDALGRQGGNHALIVAGVEVNPNDSNDVNVVLTDPGAGHLRVSYPIEQFMDAWKDSNCFMAATDNAAPYQYNPKTGMEVPSNFMVEQVFNQFIADNSYQLSPDMINIPDGYSPAYTGHLNMVGDVDYNVFEEEYEKLKASRIPIDDSDDNDDDDDNDESYAIDDIDDDDDNNESDAIDDIDDDDDDNDEYDEELM